MNKIVSRQVFVAERESRAFGDGAGDSDDDDDDDGNERRRELDNAGRLHQQVRSTRRSRSDSSSGQSFLLQ